jgi:D-aminopeptidase
VSLSATAARDLIREGARRSMANIGAIQPYRSAGPVTFQVEHTTRNSLPIDAGKAPGTELVDDRTIRYHGKDMLEAWMLYRGR